MTGQWPERAEGIVPGRFILAGPAHLPEPTSVYRIESVNDYHAVTRVMKSEGWARIDRLLPWNLSNLSASIRLGDVRLADEWRAPGTPAAAREGQQGLEVHDGTD